MYPQLCLADIERKELEEVEVDSPRRIYSILSHCMIEKQYQLVPFFLKLFLHPIFYYHVVFIFLLFLSVQPNLLRVQARICVCAGGECFPGLRKQRVPVTLPKPVSISDD